MAREAARATGLAPDRVLVSEDTGALQVLPEEASVCVPCVPGVNPQAFNALGDVCYRVAGDDDGDGGDAAEAAVAGMIRVAGVTIEDDLEEHLRAEAEAGKRAIEESARAERERKAEDQRRKAEEQEGGLPSSEYHWVACKLSLLFSLVPHLSIPSALAALGGLPASLVASLKNFHDQGQRRQALKEAMAVSAQKLLAGPEDHVGELKTLLALAINEDSQASQERVQEAVDATGFFELVPSFIPLQVSRLALLSLMAVFKDISPGYRIRPPSEQELQIKVR